MHNRFKRKVWASNNDFTGALAKWLVVQSPYVVPNKISVCIEKFSVLINDKFDFGKIGMVEIELSNLTTIVNELLESIPEIMALNESRNKNENTHIFVGACSSDPDPDNDFIDIMAVAQNIVCEFAEREDAIAFLDLDIEDTNMTGFDEMDKELLGCDDQGMDENGEYVLHKKSDDGSKKFRFGENTIEIPGADKMTPNQIMHEGLKHMRTFLKDSNE